MPKSSKAKATATTKNAKHDPFKTRKNREEMQVAKDSVTPPADIAAAVDAFREFQDQAKHFEGEATVQKDIILEYGAKEYSKRLLNGQNRSFKIEGDQSEVMYVVMDASSGITEDEAEEFAQTWGEKAAKDLIKRDLGSVRFDPKVLEANYDAVVEALQVLPKDVLDTLFKPMLMKAAPGAAEKAKQFAKNEEDLAELLTQLKIRNYVR